MNVTYSVNRGFGGGYTISIFTGGASGWRVRRIPVKGDYDPSEFERILEPAECQALMAELKRIRIPVFAGGAMGLDGVSYKLQIESGFTRLALRWWMRLPREWEDIAPLLAMLSSLADRREGRSPPEQRGVWPPLYESMTDD